MEPLEEKNIGMEKKQKSEASSFYQEVFSFIKILFVVLLFLWVMHTFVIEGYEVWGPSMMTTLSEGDRIIVFKLPCVLKNFPYLPESWKIHEGDIVVFQGKDRNERRYVKRVVAMLPSSGKVVNASGIKNHEYPIKKVEYSNSKVYVNNRVIEENYLNPHLSSSNEEDVVYLHPGEYYVLGDNRKNSKDSRIFGPILEEQIIGKAIFRFWPLSKIGRL
ncbi:MAG: signal peptidase I [Candidatus Hydrogenedentes bacterium]|nr:signal peptidase I [Candidatus Hydrogenedentota bacterium]